jgi:hypothetical protein
MEDVLIKKTIMMEDAFHLYLGIWIAALFDIFFFFMCMDRVAYTYPFKIWLFLDHSVKGS